MSRTFYPKMFVVLSFVVLVPLLLSGCQPAAPASKVESGGRKVVTFDGGAVTEGEVAEEIARLNTAQAAQTGQSVPEIEPGSPQFEAAKTRVMPQLLTFALARAYAEENGIEVSGGEVQEEIEAAKDELASRAEAAGQGDDPEQLFQDTLERLGLTEEEFEEEVRTSILVEKVQNEAVGGSGPSDEEVQDFYDENQSTLFTVPEQRCIRHVLFTSDQEEEAEEVQQQLEDGGDFAELAEEYSQDPGSAENGGDLGCQPEGGFVPEFDEAAFSAEVGEILGPVETEFGFHLIEVTEIQPEEETPLEEARPDIEEELTRRQQATEFDEFIQEELERRNVEYLPGYDPSQPALPGLPPGAEGAPPGGGAPPEGAPPEGGPPAGAAPEEGSPEGEVPDEEASQEDAPGGE